MLWKLDRLGRDLKHLVNTAEDLRVRGVGLKVLTGAGAQIDTTTANGRLAFGIFAAFAEFERELIAERTRAGLAAARARGRMGGRPRKMDQATLTMAMAAMNDPKAKAMEVAKRLGLTTTTLYPYVNGDGTPKAAGTAVLDGNLVAALFYDMSSDKEPSIPTQGERRERALQALVRQGRKPVALFVDGAHDLHHRTLVGLKRLMEVITDGGGSLTIVLVGHQKLRNDLRRPTMEEVGYRTTVFGYEGVAGHQREYITWLLNACVAADTGVSEMIDDAAMELLATRLRIPLQIEQHLVLAFEEAFRVNVKPVTVEVVESVLSRHMDDLEPLLVRHGYDARAVAELIGTKPGEVRLLLQGRLEASRAREMTEQMMAAGLPV